PGSVRGPSGNWRSYRDDVQRIIVLMPKDEMDRSQAIAGVKSPEDFYWVLSQPAPLAGMRRPWPGIPWSSLAKAGFMTVICLDGGSSNYDPAPLEKFDAVSL